MANPKITSTGFVGDLIGTASAAKSIVLEPITGYGTTIAGFQNALKAKVQSGSVDGSIHYRFVAAVDGFVANWNAGSTSYSIENGTYNELIPLSAINSSSGGFAAFLLTTYFKENQYLMVLNGGVWQKLEKVPSQADLTEIKAQITSASANYALKSHTHTSSQITDLSSSINARLSANVTASNPTLSFGSTSTIGTIAGKNLNVTMPSDPTKGQFSAVSSSADTAATWVKNNSASVTQHQIDIDSLNASVVRINNNLTSYQLYSGSWSPLPSSINLDENTCYDIVAPTASFAMVLPTYSDPENYRQKYSIAVRIGFGDTVPSITWPSGIYWANGEAPTLEANTVCEVNFVYCAQHWCVAYQTFKEATA